MLQNAILIVMLSSGAQGHWAGSVGAPCYAGNTCDYGLYCKNMVQGGGVPDFRCFENNDNHFHGHHGVTTGCWPPCSAGQQCLNQGGGNWQCIGGQPLQPGGHWNEPCVNGYLCSPGLTCQWKNEPSFTVTQRLCLYPNWEPRHYLPWQPSHGQVITPGSHGQVITPGSHGQVITPGLNSHSIHGIGGRRREDEEAEDEDAEDSVGEDEDAEDAVAEDAVGDDAVSTGDDRRRWHESTGYWNQPCRNGNWCYEGLVCQYSYDVLSYDDYTCQSPGNYQPYNPRYYGNQIWNGVISGLGNLVWDTAPWRKASHGVPITPGGGHGVPIRPPPGGRRREEDSVGEDEDAEDEDAEDEDAEDAAEDADAEDAVSTGDDRRRWGCGFCWWSGQTCDWSTWTCVSEGGDLGDDCQGNWQCSGQLECRYATEWWSRRKTCQYPRGHGVPIRPPPGGNNVPVRPPPGGWNQNSIHGIPGRRLETLDFAVQDQADEISPQ